MQCWECSQLIQNGREPTSTADRHCKQATQKQKSGSDLLMEARNLSSRSWRRDRSLVKENFDIEDSGKTKHEALRPFSEVVEAGQVKLSLTPSESWSARFFKWNGFTLPLEATVFQKLLLGTPKTSPFFAFFDKITISLRKKTNNCWMGRYQTRSG